MMKRLEADGGKEAYWAELEAELKKGGEKEFRAAEAKRHFTTRAIALGAFTVSAIALLVALLS